MTRRVLTLLGLLLGAGALAAQTVTRDSVLAWDQVGPDLATVRAGNYKLYVDAATTGTALAGVSCSGVASPFQCTAPAPVLPGGVHTLAVTLLSAFGETAKSVALSVTVSTTGVVPVNLHLVPPAAVVATFAPIADTTLNIDVPAVHAGEPTLRTYTTPDLTPANAILMKFDVSTIPATATIQQATLSLTLVQVDGWPEQTYTISAHRIFRVAPVISLATGALYDGVNPWTPVPGRTVPLAQGDFTPAYDVQALDKTLGVKTWTLTRMVQEWVNNFMPNIGMVFLNSDANALNDRFRYFASAEATTASTRPVLKVTYVP